MYIYKPYIYVPYIYKASNHVSRQNGNKNYHIYINLFCIPDLILFSVLYSCYKHLYLSYMEPLMLILVFPDTRPYSG